MEEQQMYKKQMSSSNESENGSNNSPSLNLQQNSTNCSSANQDEKTHVPTFLELRLKSRGRFIWESKFSKSVIVSILETNFQSMKVQIHYGNFKLIAKVIITKIKEEDIFSEKSIGAGVFGKVYSLNYENLEYALKVIKIKTGILVRGTLQFYKEYFLCCMADDLGVGPEIYPLCGYEIVYLKDAAFFVMEKCFRKKSYKMSSCKTQLSEGLNILHASNIVHLDLKPDNVSFSPKRQRHIFLDFGLSKIIQQQIGQKTLTRFLGTLSYCSEEMKKCYILQHEYPIDLYHNDRFALDKTLSEVQSVYENKEFENVNEVINSSSIKMCSQSKQKMIMLEGVIGVLRIKFCIYQCLFSQAIAQLESFARLPKTCYEILKCQSIRAQLNKNIGLNTLLKRIETLIFSNKLKQRNVDNKLSQFFNEKSLFDSFEEDVPIKHILKTDQAHFNRLLSTPQWIVKIFHLFNPLDQDLEIQPKTPSTVRNSIVQKICQIFGDNHRNHKYPNFICFKTEFALHFFYEKIKKLKNPKILVSLRVLLIATLSKFDPQLIRQLQNEILLLISDENQKMLRIIEFYLFWSLVNFGFSVEYPQLFGHFQAMKGNNKVQKGELSQKIYEILMVTFETKLFDDILAKMEIFDKLEELKKLNKELEYFALIENIHDLFCFLTNRDPKFLSKSYQLFVYLSSFRSYYHFHQKQMYRFRVFQETFINFRQQVKKNCTNQQYESDFTNFVSQVTIVGLEESIVHSFLPCISKRFEWVMKFAALFFAQQFQKKSSEKDIFRFLCLSQTLLGLIEEKFQDEEVDYYKRSQMSLVQYKIRNILSQIRPKLKNTSKENFFEIKLFSILIKLEREKFSKNVQVERFVCLIDQEHWSFMMMANILSTFLSLYSPIFKRKNELIIKAFENFCDMMLKKDLDHFLRTPDVLEKLLIAKKLIHKEKESIDIIFFILSRLDISEYIKNKRCGINLHKAYKKFFFGLPRQIAVDTIEQVKVMAMKSSHIEFVILFLGYHLNDEQTQKQMYLRSLKSINLIRQSYLSSSSAMLIEEALRLGLYKNQKQKRMLAKKLNFSCPLHYEFYSHLNLQMIYSIEDQRAQQFLLIKNSHIHF